MAFRYFKSQTLNMIALGLLVTVPVAAYLVHISTHHRPNLLWAGIAISLFAATFHYWRLLSMHQAPISTIDAAAQGYVELYGKASTEKQLLTPYHGIPCVWYRAWVYANQQHPRGTDHLSHHRLLEYAESQTDFMLYDGTAKCIVEPAGAEVVYFEARTWRKNNHRYVEEYLPANRDVYVIGHLDTRKSELNAKQFNQSVSAQLTVLKSKPQQLLNLYDHDLNGEIDMNEWEKARQDVMQQVKSAAAMQAHTGNFVLSKPADGHMFLISAKSPEQLRNQHKKWLAIFLVIAGAILALSFVRV